MFDLKYYRELKADIFLKNKFYHRKNIQMEKKLSYNKDDNAIDRMPENDIKKLTKIVCEKISGFEFL